MISPERQVRRTLGAAGVEIGGGREWDPVVHDARLYRRVMTQGSLGLGEAYMDGWWDCTNLAEFFRRVIEWRNRRRLPWPMRLPELRLRLAGALVNLQSRARARQVIDAHYDLPVQLFERMLGPTMAYSCGYWQQADNLEDAQRAKFDLVCRKLQLVPGDRLLDLGCGFGTLSQHAARHYGCEIVAVTLSESQARYARRHCAGLPVNVRVCDYRDTAAYAGDRPFDKVASVAMFEALGKRNAADFMRIVDERLAEHGLWLLHTIGSEREACDPWMERHIFPNGELHSLDSIQGAARRHFECLDVHDIGPDYAPTLAGWRENFLRHWDPIRGEDPQRFGERFRRMWLYYLDCCRGSFLARNLQLWQLVMSKPARPAGYQPVR